MSCIGQAQPARVSQGQGRVGRRQTAGRRHFRAPPHFRSGWNCGWVVREGNVGLGPTSAGSWPGQSRSARIYAVTINTVLSRSIEAATVPNLYWVQHRHASLPALAHVRIALQLR